MTSRVSTNEAPVLNPAPRSLSIFARLGTLFRRMSRSQRRLDRLVLDRMLNRDSRLEPGHE